MIKQTLKTNKSFIILFIILFLIFSIPLPFYIEKDGGIIPTKDRIKIENSYQSDGQFYMTYVSEIKVNIPLYIISLLNKNWDLIKKEKVVLNNETEEDVYFRSKLLLEESQQNAIISAYTLANKSIDIKNEECYVTYIDPLAETDLKIQDKLLKINNIEIRNKQHIYEILKEYKAGDIISIQVENNSKILNRSVKLIDLSGNTYIGIMVTTKKEIITTPNIDIEFKKGESGSSGGLMMALEIYNSLIKEDITNGKKIAGTGTIDEEGNVGEISGIKHKLRGANENADIFLAPAGDNYKEAIKVANEYNLDIKIIEVFTLEDAIEKLKKEVESVNKSV